MYVAAEMGHPNCQQGQQLYYRLLLHPINGVDVSTSGCGNICSCTSASAHVCVCSCVPVCVVCLHKVYCIM